MAQRPDVAPLIARTKSQGGDLEEIGQFRITVSGFKDKDSAQATVLSIAALDDQQYFSTADDGSVTIMGCICCSWSQNAYYWCPCGGVCCCNYIGPGCPA